jgi:hypothetical protein
MAPLPLPMSARVLLARGVLSAVPRIALSSSEHTLSPRGLSVNKTQSVTLGIIAVYVVVIALLWNIPLVRWSLWPFKVSAVATSELSGLCLRLCLYLLTLCHIRCL